MEPAQQPRDETRRRVLFGLGAFGAGALGASLVRFTGSGDESTVNEVSEPGVAPPPPETTPSSMPPSTTHGEATTTAAADDATETTTPSVTVACRDVWGAGPASGVMTEHVPVRLTLHHTAVGQTTLAQGPARARQHQRYHQSLGWSDLAYHFLVDRSGLAYEGRDVRFRGDTATTYDPTGHFLVCMEGDFDVQEPTDAQLETTVALFAWASQRFGIDASTLAGHGDYAVTSCPGSAVSSMLPDLAAAVADTGAVELDLVCGPIGLELIAALEAS